jgi:hypothetical protein
MNRLGPGRRAFGLLWYVALWDLALEALLKSCEIGLVLLDLEYGCLNLPPWL